MRFNVLLPTLIAAVVAFESPAEELPVILTVHNQQFVPNKLVIPAGIKIRIVVRNQDSLPVEIESVDLSREILVAAHGESSFFVGPLQPASYQFFNDFNRDMQGTIVVNSAVQKGQ